MSGTTSVSLGDFAMTLGDLIVQGAKLGTGAIGAIRLPRREAGCGCEIPAPCWAPQPLGELTSRVCPGSAAVVRLNITNCGTGTRHIQVAATDATVKIEPPQVDLGPMEQTTIVVSIEVQANAPAGQRRDVIVWVRGCKEHYMRWTVRIGRSNDNCSSDVAVEDCPDVIHHWYDHFYCQRPCQHVD